MNLNTNDGELQGHPPSIPLSEIVDQLGGQLHSQDQAVAFCPAHNDRKKPSLSLSQKQDKLFWYCHAGCSQSAITEALIKQGILPDLRRRQPKPYHPPHVPSPSSSPHPKQAFSLRVNNPKDAKEKNLNENEATAPAKRKDDIRTIEKSIMEHEDLSIVRNYLHFRGLPCDFPSCDVSAVSRFPIKQKGLDGKWRHYPAILARARGKEESGFQVHVVKEGGFGKAEVKAQKIAKGKSRGSAVWLREPGWFCPNKGALWLCEGLFTGLALQMWLDKRQKDSVVLSAGPANNLDQLTIPTNIDGNPVKRLIIALDNDKAGLSAGAKAKAAYKRPGLKVEFRVPRTEGHDWLDALIEQKEFAEQWRVDEHDLKRINGVKR